MRLYLTIVCWGVLTVAAGEGLAAEARDPAQVRAFRKTHPCPATAKTRGPCPGYVVDHIIPLAVYGPDRPDNMQWQAVAAAKVKDRLEYEAYRNRVKAEGQCRQPSTSPGRSSGG